MREVCGTVSGALLVLGQLCGYSDPKDSRSKTEHYHLVQEFARRFKEINGTIICRELLQGVRTKPGNDPEARTKEYYAARPCLRHVGEAAAIVDAEVPHTCQYFTVDDLNFLKRTGRVSGATAMIGTVLNIKPILFGDSTGHIVACTKVRGRRKSIEMLAEKYKEKKLDGPEQKICISHGDCLEDAEMLAGLVKQITPGIPITICQHEPFSGAHVGPGMLGLFFRGVER
jgi:hypothetical protein